jgi:hypothetical protein
MMSRTSPAPAADHRMEAARVGAAIACFTVAVAWPLLNLGSRNTVLHLWGSHGIDDGDIVSVIPLVVGLAMLAFPWRRRLPLGSCRARNRHPPRRRAGRRLQAGSLTVDLVLHHGASDKHRTGEFFQDALVLGIVAVLEIVGDGIEVGDDRERRVALVDPGVAAHLIVPDRKPGRQGCQRRFELREVRVFRERDQRDMPNHNNAP